MNEVYGMTTGTSPTTPKSAFNPMWIPAGLEAVSAITSMFGGGGGRQGAFSKRDLRNWLNYLGQITGRGGGTPNLEAFGIGPESLKRQYGFAQSQLSPGYDLERRRARTNLASTAGNQPGLLSDAYTSIGAGQTKNFADILAQLQIGQGQQQAGVMTNLMNMINSLIQS